MARTSCRRPTRARSRTSRPGIHNADYIQSFFDEGYTAGCGGGNYCPDAVHTRGQTAVFILKGEHGPGYVPPPCGTTHVFDDVPCPPTPEAPFGDWIGQLFVEGITAGCGGNNFCPTPASRTSRWRRFWCRHFGSRIYEQETVGPPGNRKRAPRFVLYDLAAIDATRAAGLGRRSTIRIGPARPRATRRGSSGMA